MALQTHSKLGPYEILAPLGAGGMGEVYRARDTRLRRDVAVKMLPDDFARVPERLTRFRREAQVLASLSHPHIAAIYDVVDVEGSRFLILELVEGQTLAERIAQGPIPVAEALNIARQIGDALAAAHEKGIVHRDLKPANVKITPDGSVKVLDFGLAKICVIDDGSEEPADSPTVLSAMTATGVLLGTAAYMSPEQARGKVTDHRADIWAFGCVLYEMLAGRTAFGGETSSDTVASILAREPHWADVPADTPAAISWLLSECLHKDHNRRLQHISGAVAVINATLALPAPIHPPPVRQKRSWQRAAVILLATALAVVAAALFLPRPATEAALWLSIPAPVETGATISSFFPALSPDGKQIAYTTTDKEGIEHLWRRSLAAQGAEEVARMGTSTAQPFWAPNGKSIAFFSEGKLHKVDTAGGSPQDIAVASNPRRGTWNRDGIILFTPARGEGIFRISSAGGVPQRVTPVSVDAAYPFFLPDGDRYLYNVTATDAGSTGIFVASLRTGESKHLLPNSSRAEFANGYMFYGDAGNLLARPFDVQKLDFTGEAVRISEHLGVNRESLFDYAFSTSTSGTVALADTRTMPLSQFFWFDRGGARQESVGDPAEYTGITLSPDGRTIAATPRDPKTNTMDLWTMDMEGTRSRVTSDRVSTFGRAPWSLDGKRILDAQHGDFRIFEVKSQNVENIPTGSLLAKWLLNWSPDGQYIVFRMVAVETRGDIWVLPLSGDRKAFPYLNTRFNEGETNLSPDGKWIAYASDETGAEEVFVQSFPRTGNKRRVSTSGGTFPIWTQDGKELFYLGKNGKLMLSSVEYRTSDVVISTPRALFAAPHTLSSDLGTSIPYAVSPDGQRFLFAVIVPEPPPSLTIGINVLAALKH